MDTADDAVVAVGLATFLILGVMKMSSSSLDRLVVWFLNRNEMTGIRLT